MNLRVEHYIRTLPANLFIPTNNGCLLPFSSSTFRLRISFQVTIQDRVVLGKYQWVILGERSRRRAVVLQNTQASLRKRGLSHLKTE